MRRRVLIFILALLGSSSALAQFPSELAGNKLVNGTLDIQVYMERIDNPDPFGVYGDVGKNWWFGDICFDEDTVIITYNRFAARKCREGCTCCYAVRPGREMGYTIRLPWNEEAKAYILMYDVFDRIDFTCLTVEWGRMRLRQGTIVKTEEGYVISQEHDCITYLIEEREAPFIAEVRRPGRRVQ